MTLKDNSKKDIEYIKNEWIEWMKYRKPSINRYALMHTQRHAHRHAHTLNETRVTKHDSTWKIDLFRAQCLCRFHLSDQTALNVLVLFFLLPFVCHFAFFLLLFFYSVLLLLFSRIVFESTGTLLLESRRNDQINRIHYTRANRFFFGIYFFFVCCLFFSIILLWFCRARSNGTEGDERKQIIDLDCIGFRDWMSARNW